jgi:hypothetical protein
MSEKWQRKLQALYRHSRQEKPPLELDQKIRQAAQAAVKSRRSHWKWSLPTAAVILLAVNVVLFTYVPESDDSRTITYDQYAPSSPQYQSSQGDESKVSEPMPAPAPASSRPEEVVPVPQAGDMMKNQRSQPEHLRKRDFLPPPVLQQNQAGQPRREAEKLSQALADSLQETSPAGQFQISRLPFNLQDLIRGNDQLRGVQTDHEIKVYLSDKMLLDLQRIANGIQVKAYPGAEHWGIKAEWGQSVNAYKDCISAATTYCLLDANVRAYFEDGRLAYLMWNQTNAH